MLLADDDSVDWDDSEELADDGDDADDCDEPDGDDEDEDDDLERLLLPQPPLTASSVVPGWNAPTPMQYVYGPASAGSVASLSDRKPNVSVTRLTIQRSSPPMVTRWIAVG